MKDERTYEVVAAYDTETTNYYVEIDGRKMPMAFPVLFITNDLRGIDLYKYEPGCSKINLDREVEQMLARIDDFAAWGIERGVIPVVCAYNLLFDLQPLMFALSKKYDMETNAQTSANVYTLDLLVNGVVVLRFWDTFHLELNGLYAMGKACGVEKLDCWDYNLIRRPDTDLTPEELAYAGRDTEIIPAYLRFLLESYPWLSPDMFGNKIVTKSSLVRQMAKNEIGNIKVFFGDSKHANLYSLMRCTCKRELPPSFNSFSLRRACFRGGLTFTAGNNACKVFHRVASLDVTSMHHTFIQGRRIPIGFHPANPETLHSACDAIVRVPVDAVLKNYSKPLPYGIHALVRFDNIRLREGSVFERDGIGCLARSKFSKKAPLTDYSANDYNIAQDELIKRCGFMDGAKGARFAFSKLVSADVAYVYLSEMELWNVAQVYSWDAMEPIYGEVSTRWEDPPEYVMAQSMMLYLQKNEMKDVVKNYDGTPYTLPIGSSIPPMIQEGLRAGSLSPAFVESYYNHSVKGAFNAIYGIECMSYFRPGFMVKDGEISVNPETVASSENYAELMSELLKNPPLVLYNYGMRIVGGSRMHLIIAMALIYAALGDSVIFLGGDTDSMKISVKEDTEIEDVLACLEPLHLASREAIKNTTRRCVDLVFHGDYPETTIGFFEVEPASKESIFYSDHVEFWNKARVSYVNGRAHVTFAGLPRPDGVYNIEDFLTDRIKELGFEKGVLGALGYNVTVCPELSFFLEHARPHAAERFVGDVTDYCGETKQVDAPASIALYPASRSLGETNKFQNMENVEYMWSIGTEVDITPRYIVAEDDGFIVYDPAEGIK